jgi:ATP-binding cassette subfamily C (CFTR/MRP) protein 4
VQADGDTLSGGQRARINLARALYQDAELYIFDDPLSACDQVIAGTILQRMFSGLLRDKAAIILSKSDKLVDFFDFRLTLTKRFDG